MDISPELLVEHFKSILAENYFLRVRVAELEQHCADLERRLAEATATAD